MVADPKLPYIIHYTHSSKIFQRPQKIENFPRHHRELIKQNH